MKIKNARMLQIIALALAVIAALISCLCRFRTVRPMFTGKKIHRHGGFEPLSRREIHSP